MIIFFMYTNHIKPAFVLVSNLDMFITTLIVTLTHSVTQDEFEGSSLDL